MRAVSGVVAVLLLLSGVIALAAVGAPKQQVSSDPLVVHEWGTFTSFAGSDGLRLDFRPLVENDLPPFVYDRARQAGYSFNPGGKRRIVASQRMETPVTYFYTGRPRDVRVSVGFPRGLLTEFYPPVRKLAPTYSAQAAQVDAYVRGVSANVAACQRRLDQQEGLTAEDRKKIEDNIVALQAEAAAVRARIAPQPVEGGLLDWGTVRLLPQEMAEGINLPVSKERMEHYAHARETNSAIVKFQRLVKGRGKNDPPRSETHYEKFLFYRGVGSFSLPLLLSAEAGGEFQLKNAGREAVQGLFLVNVSKDGLRFAQWDRIDGGATMQLKLPADTSSVDRLADAVTQAAVAQGLYDKEARAMVNTWRTSWFDEPGTRLFYMLPQRLVDELLPLKVDPVPDEVVRVLVGRLELMTSEGETDLHAKLRVVNCKHLPGMVHKLKEQLGRFAEPALVRARDTAPDEEVKNNAIRALEIIRAS